MMKDAFSQRKDRLKVFQAARERLLRRPAPDRDDLRNINCPLCGGRILMADLRAALYICPACGQTLPMPAHARLENLLDPGTMKERQEGLKTTNPLAFPGYSDKLDRARRQSGLNDSVVTATGRIDGLAVAIACMDSRFMMGSMGVVCGEKLVSLIEHASKRKLPLVIVATSGGARMQEGILSLMQMARTSQALNHFHAAGLLYIVVLTDPTTGGVMASFASLADITLAEPGALIGFAGPRVIQQTVGGDLPEGFQRAAAQLENGFIDAIVPREDLRRELQFYLTIHRKEGRL
ncbi:acetyl-CoA carboxylase, carboxyltransferase subunit beta [Peptococcus simiae]|uniref:acetyl-CoA carboxylase, carboxyltransferase subunit beta n=1 Tax=Peptococcus simiae TaxID=1643805 RepID=UPI00397FAAEE